MVSLYNHGVLLNSSPCWRKFEICCHVDCGKKWRRKPRALGSGKGSLVKLAPWGVWAVKANLTHGDLGADEKLRERGMKRSGKRTTKFSWHLPCKSVCISGSLMVYNRNIPWVFLHERPLIERIELRESAKGLKTADIRGVWGSGLRTGWLT